MRLASDDSLVSAIKEPLFLGDLPLGTYVASRRYAGATCAMSRL